MPRWIPPLVLGCLAVALSRRAGAATYEVHPGDDLFNIWANLNPGDVVVVHGGSYQVGGYHTQHWQGSPDQPIVVRAADGERPVIQGDPSQNAMNLSGSYFTFQGFEIQGGSHGLRLESTHDATIQDLEIHDTADVALSANRDGNEYHHIHFLRLHLHHTGGSGEGMYLGCNYGACSFHDNVIEDSWIHDTNHGVAQGDGIEIKFGSYGNVIRDNVVYATNYPCIIVYGTDGHDPNIIENNAMWDCGDAGIQAAADAVIRNNLIFRAVDGILSHAHQGAVPSNLTIVNNTVVACSDACLRASDWAGSQGIVVANNALYCDTTTALRVASGGSDATFSHNVVVGSVQGVSAGISIGNSATQDLEDPDNLDAWPTDTSPLIDAGDPAHAPPADFNWNPRDAHPDVGAYEWRSGGNPGWQPGPGPRTGPDGGPADAEVPDAGNGEEAWIDVGTGATPIPDAAQSTADASGTSGGSKGSGCSCRAATHSGPMTLALFLALAAFLRRRRK